MAKDETTAEAVPAATPDRKGRPSARAYRGPGELWDIKDRYLDWLVSTGYARISVTGAHNDLSWFLRHVQARGVDRIADITPEVLEAYAISLREPRNGLPPAPRSVNRRVIAVKQFFKWLGREGLILYDPAEDLELPRLPSELPHTILTEDEVWRLLNAPDLTSPVGYRDRAMLELFFGTGIRSSELMRLSLSDIDHRHRTVLVRQGKGGLDRLVPAPAVALAFVKEYAERVRPAFARSLKKDDGTLFLSYTGSRMTPTRLVEVFKRSRKAAGLDKHVTAITLRHTIATLLLESGMGSRYIQDFLGHEKLSTTQVYTKLTLSGLKKHYAAAHPMERRGRRGNGPGQR